MNKQQEELNQMLKIFSPRNIAIAAGIGLVYMVYALMKKIDFASLKEDLANASYIWFVIAFIVLLARDGGYMYRIRSITDKKLSWLASVYVILLWEFSSAVTPSVVGGTAVAIFILKKEGLSIGKSMAMVMLTALLDNMFFIIAAPIAIFLTDLNGESIFPVIEGGEGILVELGMQVIFWISYFLIALYALLFAFGLFINPKGFKWLLFKLCSIKFLRKFRKGAIRTGQDVEISSKQLQGKNTVYWAKAIFSTLFVWLARYLMLNCLLEAFKDIGFHDHVLVFGRQIAMWIVMLVSPTPGSSGTAEASFSLFYGEFLGNTSFAVAILWRLYYYYPYLIIGAFILTPWIRRVYAQNKKTNP